MYWTVDQNGNYIATEKPDVIRTITFGCLGDKDCACAKCYVPETPIR